MGGAPLDRSVVKPNTCRHKPARWIAYDLYNPKCGGVMPEIGLNLGPIFLFEWRLFG